MSGGLDTSGFVEVDDDLYPAERIGPDGRPLPITDEQAARIAEVLAEEFESNPAFREVVNERAAELAAKKGAA